MTKFRLIVSVVVCVALTTRLFAQITDQERITQAVALIQSITPTSSAGNTNKAVILTRLNTLRGQVTQATPAICAPSTTLSVTPTTLPASGGTVTAIWSAPEAVLVTLGGIIVSLSGTISGSLTQTMAITLIATCANGQTNTKTVTVTVAPVTQGPFACSDGLDNDADGFIDLADPGCVDSSDNDETSIVAPPPPPPNAGAGVSQGATETKVCTTALTGARTFNARTDAELDVVPWASLQAGDVVNIYHKAAAYKVKFGLSAKATAANPVIINGVSDTACNKPVIDGSGARTASGSKGLWSTTPEYGESLGVIVIKRAVADAYAGPKPSGIRILGLQVMGGRNGATYTRIGGGTSPYGDGSGVYVHVGTDISVENTILNDNAFGLFVMAKDGSLLHAGERISLLNSRVYGNGVVGAYYQHGVYMQSANPRVRGNYLGQLRSGAQGSSYKSRSSGEIISGNYVVCHARCLDLVHSEDQTPSGIVAQADYGMTSVHDNVIVSQGPEAAHYGGDNMGEQDAGGGIFVPPIPYRERRLYFYNNTFTQTGSEYRKNVFDVSHSRAEVYAWANTFNLTAATGVLSWLEWAGQLFLGTNTVNGPTPVNARDGATNDGRYVVTTGVAPPTVPAGLQ